MTIISYRLSFFSNVINCFLFWSSFFQVRLLEKENAFPYATNREVGTGNT